MSGFGAQPLPGGGVRFRLWAPAASTVELVFDSRRIPMQKGAEGWFEVVEPAARAGSLYRY